MKPTRWNVVGQEMDATDMESLIIFAVFLFLILGAVVNLTVHLLSALVGHAIWSGGNWFMAI